MTEEFKKTRAAIRRVQAERYILTSLVAFAITVIATRVFLQLTGFPQVGNSVLHIAHALWGGLLLVVALYLPLAYANRWVFQTSAILGGVGIGLFIDEVGKFITQANDYFFPPALPLIYGFILIIVLVYLYFRRPLKVNPRRAMYDALEGLQDILDGDLDVAEAAQIEAQLIIAKQSDREELVSLANTLSNYLHREKEHLTTARPGFWKRTRLWIDAVGQRFGRRRHRVLITIVLLGWVAFVVAYLAVIIQGVPNLDPEIVQMRVPLIGIQVIVGILMLNAAIFWLAREENLGLKFGVTGLLVSLVAFQLLYFYLSQFLAITMTLIQVAILLILFAYRRWNLDPDN